MKVVDLNVLIYAINRAAPLHERVAAWWESALNGPDPIALSWPVINAFIRLTTRTAICPRPLSVDAASAYVDRWLELPAVRLLTESERHWSLSKELLRETGAAGNLTTDAHLAALAMSHAATLVSCDNDFARFPGCVGRIRHVRSRSPSVAFRANRTALTIVPGGYLSESVTPALRFTLPRRLHSQM